MGYGSVEALIVDVHGETSDQRRIDLRGIFHGGAVEMGRDDLLEAFLLPEELGVLRRGVKGILVLADAVQEVVDHLILPDPTLIGIRPEEFCQVLVVCLKFALVQLVLDFPGDLLDVGVM